MPPDKIVMVGGSHGCRISDELDSSSYDLADLSVPGWKISEENVEEKADELKEHLLECDRETPL